MTESIFSSLLNMIDGRTVGDVAHAMGQPEQAVRHGMESSIAAVLSGLTAQSGNSGALQRVVDMVPSTGGQASWSQMAGSLADSHSPSIAAGSRLLPALFGSGESAVTSALSRASNLSPGVMTTLLTMAGPIVMSFLSKNLRDGTMTADSLRGALQRESGTIRNALPAGVSEVFWPGVTTASSVSPVVAQTVHKEGIPSWVLPAVICGALALGLVWLLGHARRPSINQAVIPPVVGEANRVVPHASQVGCTLPSTVVLPRDGLASRFLIFMQNQPATSGFNADQLLFDTGSAQLRPESQAQLNDLATVLTDCPNVRMRVVGFTDNVGNATANLGLSRNRANNIVSKLESCGVSADRLMPEGDGDQYPIADNATSDGRARNRRVAFLIMQPPNPWR